MGQGRTGGSERKSQLPEAAQQWGGQSHGSRTKAGGCQLPAGLGSESVLRAGWERVARWWGGGGRGRLDPGPRPPGVCWGGRPSSAQMRRESRPGLPGASQSPEPQSVGVGGTSRATWGGSGTGGGFPAPESTGGRGGDGVRDGLPPTSAWGGGTQPSSLPARASAVSAHAWLYSTHSEPPSLFLALVASKERVFEGPGAFKARPVSSRKGTKGEDTVPRSFHAPKYDVLFRPGSRQGSLAQTYPESWGDSRTPLFEFWGTLWATLSKSCCGRSRPPVLWKPCISSLPPPTPHPQWAGGRGGCPKYFRNQR